jgi:predicted permease
MESIFQDFRYAFRQLRKNPVFAAIAVITLALAVGANTAIFSVVQTVLLAPLPYQHIDRLAMIWGRNPSRGDMQAPISPGDFTDWKQKNRVFEDIAPSTDDQVTLTGAGEPKLLLGYDVSPSYFRILGVAPRMGRVFTEDEASSGAQVAVLSDKIWRNIFHGDPQILGKSITLDSKPYAVIGVMPPAFNFPSKTELWMPMTISAAASGDYKQEDTYIRVLGRLKPGISLAEAQVRMNALERQIAAQHPDTDAGNETWVEPLRHVLSGDIRTPLLALFWAVGLVLIIACVNIAGLLLARAARRQVEVSLRVAIGASRLRLLQQFLCESLLLSFLGGAVGVVLALWCTRFLLAIFPNGIANLNIPRVEAIPMNAPVLWFALGITVATGLLFGVVPAMQLARTNGNEALKESRGSTSSVRSARVRRFLVAAEIALSLVLLAGGGLMIESFRRVYQENLGFRPDPVLAVEVLLPSSRYPSDQRGKRDNFVSGVTDRLSRLPGAASVAVTNFLPLTGFWGITDFTVEGQAVRPDNKPSADNRLVTPGYFSTMGISLLRGRDFNDSDRSESENVAIVNSTLARRYFGGENPVDKILELGDAAHPERWRIVGEVADVRAFGPEEPAHADLYRPLSQVSFPLLSFVVRTTGDPSKLLKPAESAIWEVDKDQPVFDAMPMQMLAAQSVTLRRTSTILLASFAGLALMVAAVGLYGLIAYSVAQRTHEIGIRMALGARRRDVLGLVVRHGMSLVLVGEIVGLGTALIVTRLVSGLLYEVSPADPWPLAAAVGVMTLIALVASYIPARRAAKIDPMVALRYE